MTLSTLLKKSMYGFILCLLILTLLPVRSTTAASPAHPLTGAVSITPAAAPNNAGTHVTIEGIDFTPATTASLGATFLTTIYVSPTQLTADVPWGLTPGIYDLTISDPAQAGPSILPNAFTVTLGLGKWINNGPFGGMVNDLVFQPGSPDRLYACIAAAGLFVSEDGGDSWSMLINNSFPMHLKISPADPKVLYLNTNRQILRSLDAGVSWSEIYPHDDALGGTLVAFPHPSDPATVIISIVPGINGYNFSNYNTLGTGELWISHDHGDTKTVLANATLTDRRITELAFDPQDATHQTLVAGTLAGKIFRSTNGGVSWTLKGDLSVGVDASLLPARIDRLSFNPVGGEAWAVRNNPFLTNSWPVFFRASADLSTWTGQLMTNPIPFGPRGWSLAFGQNKIWAATGKGYTSPITGAVSWSVLTPAGVPDETWRTFEFTAFAFAGSNTVYGGTFEHGIYKSTDGGLTWVEANRGLAGIIPYALAVAPDNLDEIYSVSPTDGMAKSSDGGQHWTLLNFKRNSYPWVQTSLVVDPSSPDVVYLGNGCPIQGTPYGNACVTISRNRGATWQNVTLPAPGSYQKGEVYAVAANPAFPGWVVAGATFFPLDWMQQVEHPLGAFYFSSNYGQNWTRSNIDPALLKGSYTISYDRGGLVAYAGTDGGGLWLSADRGSTWSSKAWTSCPADSRVYAAAANPLVDGQVFAYCEEFINQQFVPGGLFRSDNYGADWAPVNVPQTGIRSLQFVNSPRGMVLYAGGWAGAARSLDYGVTWAPIDGLPAGEVSALSGSADQYRSSVYFSTSAGMGNGAAALTSLAAGASAPRLMAGGTYGLTQKLPQPVAFLPLIIKKP